VGRTSTGGASTLLQSPFLALLAPGKENPIYSYRTEEKYPHKRNNVEGVVCRENVRDEIV
jgi:hypothetical protein